MTKGTLCAVALAGTISLFARDAARGDMQPTAPDQTRIRSDLDWEPAVSLEDGLARQWEWPLR